MTVEPAHPSNADEIGPVVSDPGSDPADRRPRRLWFHRVALMALVVALLAAVGVDAAVMTTQHRSAASLRATDQVLSRTRTTLSTTKKKTKFTTAVGLSILASQAKTEAEISAAEKSLGSMSQTAMLQSLDIATLQTCLTGVANAVTAINSSNLPGAVSSISGASSSCLSLDNSSGGPVYPFDFPDPFVLPVGSQYFAFATNSAEGNIQIIQSSDLTHWSAVGDALPHLASWAKPGATWGPSVIQLAGSYVLYYSAIVSATGQQCISDAVASQPQGPYIDSSTSPLMCQAALGGSMDPSPFVDANGTPYLIWKSQGVSGQPPTLWSEQLTAAGTALAPASPPPGTVPTPPTASTTTTTVALPPASGAGGSTTPGTPTALLTPSRSWQGGVVEGPDLVLSGGQYLLFYSANNWETSSYAVGYATCTGPLGPCTDASPQPLLASGQQFAGPGGPSVFTDPKGGLWMAFHGWLPGKIGYPNSRLLFVSPMTITGGVPQLNPPGG
jgi:Glycosyl hydrolases family 43